MKSISTILFVILNLLLVSSCECPSPNCWEEIPFIITDNAGSKDLVFGSSPLYNKDSIRLRTGNFPFFRTASLFDSTSFYLPVADTVYLRLSEVDVDTVVVKYKFGRKSVCCHDGYAKADVITFNGKPASRQGQRFLFEK